MLVSINHGICRCHASRVGFPAVMSRPSLYPSLAKSELAVCITRSPRGLTRHRCAYLPLFSLASPSPLSPSPPPFTPCRTSRGIRSACHVLEHEELARRMCEREKRERNSKRLNSDKKERKTERRRKMWRGANRKSDENGDAIEEKSVLGEKGRERGGCEQTGERASE